jgi:chaperone LolA
MVSPISLTPWSNLKDELRARMKKFRFSVSLLAICFLCSGALATGSKANRKVQTADRSDTAGSSEQDQASQTSEKLAFQVEEKYRSIKDLSMNFTKTLKSEIFESQKKIKGMMYLKNPDKFRIETEDETIVTDGKFLWSYSEQNEQVIKSILDKSKNIFKPNQYLSNFREEYKAKLTGEEKIDKAKCYKLTLSPKKKDLFITRMTIWVGKKNLLAKRIEYTDVNDNQITLLFDHIRTNKGIKDSKFVFQAPEGVEELDLTE